MLKNESMVIVADNSGAKKAKIIRILKGSNAKTATVGDVVVVAIKEAAAGSNVKKGSVMQAMVIRVKKEIGRKDGTYVRFGDNAIVLMSKNDKGDMSPVGKRIFGPVARELRDLGHKDISNMAEEVI